MYSYKKISLAVIISTLVLSVILILIHYRSNEPAQEKYVLKEYNGSVALFRNGDVLSVYDEIVLSAFPNADRQRFSEGIPVNSPEDAVKIIEDYDG